MERLKSLSLASCNIEGDKHIKTIREFLQQYSPDVVCFQEAIEDNMEDLARMFDYSLFFKGCTILSKNLFGNLSSEKILGLAVLSHHPINDSGSYTYAGNPYSIPIYQRGKPNSSRRELVYASMADEYTFATTHFTWTPEGKVNEEQLQDIKVLIEKAKLIGDCVLTGDFNAPRPNAIYQQLTADYKDEVPDQYTSSLDPNLHRLGRTKELLVDYIFSTSKYRVTDVRLIDGVSDHKALIAQVAVNK